MDKLAAAFLLALLFTLPSSANGMVNCNPNDPDSETRYRHYEPIETGDCYHRIMFSGENGEPMYRLDYLMSDSEDLEKEVQEKFSCLLDELQCSEKAKNELKKAVQSVRCIAMPKESDPTQKEHKKTYCEFKHEKYGEFQFMRDHLTSSRSLYMVLSHWD